jgi:lipid-binding SYLF domain-containing protein
MYRFIPATVFVIGFTCLAPGSAAAAIDAADKAKMDSAVDGALSNLYTSVPGSQDITARAAGILVFPRIGKTSFLVGAEHGDGALRIGNNDVDYYKLGGLSFGIQVGGERRSMVMAFMTQDALQRFQASSGWDVGADATVAVVKTGASGKVDASQLDKPVQIFIFGEKGLMASVALGGTKITKTSG